MDDNERQWLQRELDDIKNRIDGLPCLEHGKVIDILQARYENGQQFKKSTRNLIAILISAGMLVLSVLTVYAAFIKK